MFVFLLSCWMGGRALTVAAALQRVMLPRSIKAESHEPSFLQTSSTDKQQSYPSSEYTYGSTSYYPSSEDTHGPTSYGQSNYPSYEDPKYPSYLESLDRLRSQMAVKGGIEGFPDNAVPILPEFLDEPFGVETSDYVFDVAKRSAAVGAAGSTRGVFSTNTKVLQGEHVSFVLFNYQFEGENQPHYHPRATELQYVIKGKLLVGFTDTEGKFWENWVPEGSASIFPQGSLHYQICVSPDGCIALSGLGNENPGSMFFPGSLYQLPDQVLSNSLRQSVDGVRNDRDRLVPDSRRQSFPERGSEKNTYDNAGGSNGVGIVPNFKEKVYGSVGSSSGGYTLMEESLEKMADNRPIVDDTEKKPSAAAPPGVDKDYYSKYLEYAVEGFPDGGVPILPYERDYAFGLKAEDFVFAVKGANPAVGRGGQVTSRTVNNVKALQGRSISMTLFELQPYGQNVPHYHPRAAEISYLVSGKLLVGFTDTSGKYFENYVEAGQGTIFPKAMLHFQICVSANACEFISFLGSENPGVMSLPRSLYISTDQALSNAFREKIDNVRNDRDRLVPSNLRADFQPGSGYKPYDGDAGLTGVLPVPAFTQYKAQVTAAPKAGCIYNGVTTPHGGWLNGSFMACTCDDGKWVSCTAK
eukprot:gb/GEZN01003074.1/.p1 GENE.gb/GEZN01003074.1/~~gb/GEZN01003074.1/.p1  ORF type:complete len:639 (+),score=64.01 gb/GEZN01003074.1/:46-1962(+)